MDIKSLELNRADLNSGASDEALAARARHAKTPSDIKKAAVQFEGLLLQQMLKSMWATVPHEKGSLSASNEEATYRDMFNEALATKIAEKSSLGIASVIERDMKQIEARTHGTTSKPVVDQKSELQVTQGLRKYTGK